MHLRKLSCALLIVAAWAFSCDACRAEPSDESKKLAAEVWSRLVAGARPDGGRLLPPGVEIADRKQINAFAQAQGPAEGGKRRYRVTVTAGTLTQVVDNEPDRLAFILGHELAHVLLGHADGDRERTPFLEATFTREQELAADTKGMELALTAGYSYRKALRGIQRMIELGVDYSSFEGLRVDHPAWKDRLTSLDREQSTLWQAMSAFDNGAVFLSVEQYAAAERCFRAVTRDFPSCTEAWGGLGYALLMQYCDGLEPADLRRFGVGQIACGAFYRRPATLEAQVRGINEEVWWDAVEALREALRLNPNLVLAKANLGIAYLVRPAGRDTAQAARFLQEAAEAVLADATLDPLSRAAALSSAGVADLAAGQRDTSSRRFEQAEKQARAFATQGRPITGTVAVEGSLLYNRAALLLADGDPKRRHAGVDVLTRFLKETSASSVWWSLAYEDYRKVCGELKLTAQPAAALASSRTASFRPVTGVQISPGKSITLSDRTADVLKRIGATDGAPIAPGTSLQRYRYPVAGVEFLGSERVLAVMLSEARSPGVILRRAGLGGQSATLRVGTSRSDLDDVIGDQQYDFRQLLDPEVNYRFYRDLGLAVRLHEGKVAEIVVVQAPERRLPGSN